LVIVGVFQIVPLETLILSLLGDKSIWLFVFL